MSNRGVLIIESKGGAGGSTQALYRDYQQYTHIVDAMHQETEEKAGV